MEWVEVTLAVGELADEVAAILVEIDVAKELTADGVAVRGGEVVVWRPVAEGEAAAAVMRLAATRMRDAGLPVSPDEVYVRPAPPESEWRDAWKKHFHVTHITKRIVIVPSWEKDGFTPTAEDIVLDLDPGRAFGTGAHASTRLCLVEMERLFDQGHQVRRVLDVGAGSGILTIAAAKIWPEATGIAIDIDPEAVAAAAENFARNDVTGRLESAARPVDEITGAFELVFANIQADVLERLRDPLVARVAPGGVLVLSGILDEQAEGVRRHFEAAGLTKIAMTNMDDLAGDALPEPGALRGWTSVVLKK